MRTSDRALALRSTTGGAHLFAHRAHHVGNVPDPKLHASIQPGRSGWHNCRLIGLAEVLHVLASDDVPCEGGVAQCEVQGQGIIRAEATRHIFYPTTEIRGVLPVLALDVRVADMLASLHRLVVARNLPFTVKECPAQASNLPTLEAHEHAHKAMLVALSPKRCEAGPPQAIVTLSLPTLAVLCYLVRRAHGVIEALRRAPLLI
mmetsp:Transcript_126289/g.365576  ORF Transcript_126289/g.365576 Transcript_126289/m.365576 type:complete len:204 (-) Transcript_126289:652-1263(-)